ncbi:MAG: translocation/assembly module TamB domain-containing protein [Nitrospirae bacterium]|nr:translocation/assembly module TamB domain-containing protein [Nitrospirota bacterium]
MKRKFTYIAIIIIVFGLILYALRGPNISNQLKRLILPELELATGNKFIARKIYINIFPLFIEMKGIKAFDDNGNNILAAERAKGYIAVSGLFRKEIIIKRLVIKNPEIQSDRVQVEEIIANVKKRLAEPAKMPFKVIIKSVDVVNATLFLKDKDAEITLKGLNAEIIASDTTLFRISSEGVKIIKKGLPDLQGMIETLFVLKERRIEVKSLKIMSYKSEVRTSGVWWLEKLSGSFKTEMNIIVDSIKKIFGLKNSGEGTLSASGTIKIDDGSFSPGTIAVDLKLKGDLYLETLMELLAVKEKLKGHMSIKGALKGPLNNLKAEGNAELEKGNLFGVEVDRLNCGISYSDGAMHFNNARAALYKGTASAEAVISLPVVNYYSLHVKAKDVSSKGLFKLIGWDPRIPEGRANGEIESSGSSFNPHGTFDYRSIAAGRDIIGQVKELKGEFNMQGKVISFPRLFVSTGKSNLETAGEVDLRSNTLGLRGSGTATDINEFFSPYFTALSGTGSFLCSVTGPFQDPLIDIRFTSGKASLRTGNLGIPDVLKSRVINFDSAEGILSYKKNLLTVRGLSLRSAKEEFRASGNVRFEKARSLFELQSPDYDLNISVKNIDIKSLSGTFQDGPPFTGTMQADFRLYGKPGDIRADGDVHAGNLSWNGVYSVDAGGKASYKMRAFSFSALQVKRGNSELSLQGSLSLDKRFSFVAEGKRVTIADAVSDRQKEMLRTHYKELFVENFFDTISLMNLRVKGEGDFNNPHIELDGDVKSGTYRGRRLGKGDIHGTINNGRIDIDAHLFDRKMLVKGNATLNEKIPWAAHIELQPARYDFIIANFMKDVPDDLLLNMRGVIVAHGDKDRVDAVATIQKAHLYFYGTGFTNSSTIVAHLEDKKLSIESLSMKSDAAEFRLSGNVLIGKRYDLLFEGSSALSPLKALFKNIEVIKGNTSFVFSVTGGWDKPKVNGDMDVTSGTLGFKNFHYRLSSVSAYLYVDEDRIVLDRLNGKFSGGDVVMSGTAYLQKFAIKRFSLESKLKGITASVSKDLWASLDGELYYRGTMDSQTLLGDIAVKRAKYTERIEWKSWLFRTRQRERARVEPTKIDLTNLNIRVTGPNLTIDNNVARAVMTTDILLRGTIGQPIVLGKIEAKEGIVYFRNNEFKIVKAAVDFSNPNQIRPYFDIVAETKVRSYNIRLSLDGYAEQFNLSLSSDPLLNEADIFSLLTVGDLGKNLKGLEGGIGAGEATSFLTGKLQDVLEERVKTITGFDRVQIDPYVSRYTGTVAPRVTIAKRLMGDKLYVTYSTSVTTGEEQIWKLEYLLGKNISLIGVRDERGGLGGDVKFRFEFK